MNECAVHPLTPVFDENSELLILGSFPSVRSREVGFYYGHSQNRFWRLLGALTGEEVPTDTEGKRKFLLAHRIALWDVVASCCICGSSDSSIDDVLPNDVASLLSCSHIRNIYTNGRVADMLYQKYIFPSTHMRAVYLPSTSPANAAWSLTRLCEAWQVILGKQDGGIE